MKIEDKIAVGIAIGTLISYHIYLYLGVFLLPNQPKHAKHVKKTQLAQMIDNASFWVKKHQEKEDAANVTLAIQTLRNTILVAIFVGGSALNLGLSYSNGYNDEHDTAFRVRAIILSILCFCSFLSWVMVIRYASQVGYLIGTINLPRYKEVPKAATTGATEGKVEGSSSTSMIPVPTIGAMDSVVDFTELNKKTKKKMMKRCLNVTVLMTISFK